MRQIGKNTVAGYPKAVAKFINKEDHKNFTGHAFRRNAATLLCERGVSVPILKVAGGWESYMVDGAVQVYYINESTKMKKTIATTLPIGNQAKQALPGENSVTTEPGTTRKTVVRP